MEGFFQRIYALVRQIPAGRVMSYSAIARALGAPGAARQVGWAMRRCPEDVPWQWVIRADGSVPSLTHPDLWRGLLEAEGVRFLPDGRGDMAACRWSGPDG